MKYADLVESKVCFKCTVLVSIKLFSAISELLFVYKFYFISCYINWALYMSIVYVRIPRAVSAGQCQQIPDIYYIIRTSKEGV
jgi:hypothetical protein